MLPALLGLILPPSVRPMPSYGEWTSSALGGGGYVQGVELTPKNPKRAYAWVDVGGFYRSDDAGRSWRMLQGALPPNWGNQAIRDLAADPRNPDRFLVAAGDHWSSTPEGVWITGDGGKSFRKVLNAAFAGNADFRWAGRLIAFHPKNADRVLVGTMGSGAFVSGDGGRTFRSVGLDKVNATDVDWDRTTGSRAWVCAQPYDSWYFGVQNAGLSGGFWRTEDGGQNWTKLLEEGPSEVLQDPQSARRLIGIFKNGRLIQESTDHGATWSPLTDGLQFDPANTGSATEFEYQTLVAGPNFVLTQSSAGSVYRLLSGTRRWLPLPKPRVSELYQGRPWYGAWDGKSWRHFGKAAAQLTIDPKNPSRWFFTDWFAIWQSLDAGRSWALSMDGVEVTVIHCLLQDPTDSSVVHLGMADNGYLRSSDGGRSFLPGKLNSNMKAIAANTVNPQRLFGLGDPSSGEWVSNTLFRSVDRGKTWMRMAPIGLPDMRQRRMNSLVIDPRRSEVVYVAVDGPVKPGGGGVYRSDDGGNRFEWAGAGLPADQPFFQSEIWVVGKELAMSADGSLVALSTSRREVWRYDPVTRQWALSLPSAATPNDVVADPHQGGVYYLARREEGLLRSTDSGRNWEVVFEQPSSYVTVDLANRGRVAVGFNVGVAVSGDRGQTWTTLDERLPNRLNPRVAFSGDRLVVGTSGSGTFWTYLPDL